MSVSTTIPTTVQIRRGRLIGLILAAAVLAATITWLLVAVAFDSEAGGKRRTASCADAGGHPGDPISAGLPWNAVTQAIRDLLTAPASISPSRCDAARVPGLVR